jgi:hypothetical protein
MNKIRNLIKRGIHKRTIDTKKVEVSSLGKTQEAFLYIPYGTHFKLPSSGITAILLQREAYEDRTISLPTDASNRDEVDDKEVAYGVPTLKARVKFTKDDKIVYTIGSTEGGDYAVRYKELESAFNELKQDFNDVVQVLLTWFALYNSHTHQVNISQATANPTANVYTQQPQQSQADITGAKVQDIELPSKGV